MMIPTLLAAASTLVLVRAQQVGTSTKEVHPTLTTQTCTSAGCKDEATKIVLDANWRWLHNVGGSTNCYTGNTWNAELCPDAATCAKNCALDGADYTGTYGITAASDSLAMKLVTKGAYSTNIGSRVYVMEDDEKYKMYKLLNQEFAFDVDVSKTPCGLNGALYFVQMDQDGGKARFPTNKAGAAYGTGYCDAQCPHDLKFVDGEANVEGWKPSKMDVNSGTGTFGSCCAEMDIWEANSVSNAYTPHPCTVTEQTRCTGTECGDDSSSERYKGVCDKDGCDWNPFRMGTKTFFGPGATFAVDSTKPFTVVTQFITDDKTAEGNLVEIKRFYKQNGKVIANPNANIKGIDAVNSITDKMCSQQKTAFADPDDHAKKGGLKAMGKALQKGVVLAISMWTDSAAQCLWLDSNYPLTKSPSVPGVARGTCATTSGVPSEVVASSPDATVKFSNIRVGAIGSTTEGVSAAANSSTAPAASKADDADDAGEDSGSADAPATTPAATTKAPAASKADDDAADADDDKSGSADTPATTPATTTKAPAPAASKADDDADDDETDKSGSTDSPATDAPATTAPATTAPATAPASTPAAPAETTKAPSKKCKARRA